MIMPIHRELISWTSNLRQRLRVFFKGRCSNGIILHSIPKDSLFAQFKVFHVRGSNTRIDVYQINNSQKYWIWKFKLITRLSIILNLALLLRWIFTINFYYRMCSCFRRSFELNFADFWHMVFSLITIIFRKTSFPAHCG